MQSLEQSIGARLKVTVNYQPEPIEGVLVAADPQTQTLVLRRLLPLPSLPRISLFSQTTHTNAPPEDNATTEMNGSHDYCVVVGAFVTAIASLSIAAPNTAPLPPVDWAAAERREEAARAKLRARAARLGVGVTPAQQALFDVLARVYRDSRWGAAGEMLIEDAVIRAPYTARDVSGPDMLVNRIRLVCGSFLFAHSLSLCVCHMCACVQIIERQNSQ